jgi:hypothetical protein
MRGFKNHAAASRFCHEHGELRNLLRPRRRHDQIVPASLRRSRFATAAQSALAIMQAG